MKTYPRREFLLRALAACGTPLLLPAAAASAQKVQPGRAAQAAVSYFGGDVTAVHAIGELYLRQLGRDQGIESILEASRGALETIERSPNQQAAVAALVRAVRRDFQQGRSVQLEGWILSRTEAELCALTLLPPAK
jgi:hypothetical protein